MIKTTFVIVVSGVITMQAWAADVAIKTLTYGQHHLFADIYSTQATRTPGLHPAVIFIHGGGWSAGDRTEFTDQAKVLAQNGVVAIAIDYRLANVVPWPAQADDVEQAVWWVRENATELGIDPKRVGVIGGSAGAHLAGWLATSNRLSPKGTPARPNAVIALWGPWDLTQPTDTLSRDANNIITALLGPNGNRRAASPQYRIDSNTAPTLIFHGKRDRLVPYSQSVNACAAIKSAGAPCNLVLFENEGHDGIKHKANSRLMIEFMATFLKAHLFK